MLIVNRPAPGIAKSIVSTPGLGSASTWPMAQLSDPSKEPPKLLVTVNVESKVRGSSS